MYENNDFRVMREEALKEQYREREQPKTKKMFKCSKCGYESDNPDDFTTNKNKYVCFWCYFRQNEGNWI